jgi:hypothetical protein
MDDQYLTSWADRLGIAAPARTSASRAPYVSFRTRGNAGERASLLSDNHRGASDHQPISAMPSHGLAEPLRRHIRHPGPRAREPMEYDRSLDSALAGADSVAIRRVRLTCAPALCHRPLVGIERGMPLVRPKADLCPPLPAIARCCGVRGCATLAYSADHGRTRDRETRAPPTRPACPQLGRVGPRGLRRRRRRAVRDGSSCREPSGL